MIDNEQLRSRLSKTLEPLMRDQLRLTNWVEADVGEFYGLSCQLSGGSGNTHRSVQAYLRMIMDGILTENPERTFVYCIPEGWAGNALLGAVFRNRMRLGINPNTGNGIWMYYREGTDPLIYESDNVHFLQRSSCCIFASDETTCGVGRCYIGPPRGGMESALLGSMAGLDVWKRVE